MDKQINKGMLKDIQNIARKKKNTLKQMK